MSILKCADLSICAKCKRHAHVVLPDGKTSGEFLTLEDGLKEIAKLLAAKRIIDVEAEFLESKVAKLPIPETTTDLVALMLAADAVHEEDMYLDTDAVAEMLMDN